MVKDSTAPFALSASGDGSISDAISVPRHCNDPAVLIQPAANRTIYIANLRQRRLRSCTDSPHLDWVKLGVLARATIASAGSA
jgi:hypothetical protein